MCGSDYAVLSVPEVGCLRIGGGNVDRDSDVEHFAQPYLPLFYQAGGSQDEQSANMPRGQQRREDKARFNSLAKSHIVRHQPPCWPRLEHALANPELVRQ